MSEQTYFRIDVDIDPASDDFQDFEIRTSMIDDNELFE